MSPVRMFVAIACAGLATYHITVGSYIWATLNITTVLLLAVPEIRRSRRAKQRQ